SAEKTLHCLGAASVPDLVMVLADGRNPFLQARAANILGQMGPSAAQAIVPLTAALAGGRWAVCREAAEALGKTGQPTPATAAALTKLLRHDHSDVRQAAAGALRRFGPLAASALCEVLEALADASKGVQDAALTALRQILADTPDAALGPFLE